MIRGKWAASQMSSGNKVHARSSGGLGVIHNDGSYEFDLDDTRSEAERRNSIKINKWSMIGTQYGSVDAWRSDGVVGHGYFPQD
jgi:hypothetical protein